MMISAIFSELFACLDVAVIQVVCSDVADKHDLLPEVVESYDLIEEHQVAVLEIAFVLAFEIK